MDICLL